MYRCLVLWIWICATLVCADNKYFHEPGDENSPDYYRHYDKRFFSQLVSEEERKLSLSALVRAYILLFDQLGLQTWLAHGTLLGWYWNGAILPWDWDLDTQVTNATLHNLGANYNHTYHDYHSPLLNVTRRYLLDINPWIWERVLGDGDNIIDGRFIDTSNGLFLDITGLAPNDPEKPNIIACKNEHKYNVSDIFPLRETLFEGVPAKVPFAYTEVLIDEYNESALFATNFMNHTFNVITNEWQKVMVPTDKESVPNGGAYS